MNFDTNKIKRNSLSNNKTERTGLDRNNPFPDLSDESRLFNRKDEKSLILKTDSGIGFYPIANSGENLKVFIRVRPAIEREKLIQKRNSVV